VYNCLLIFAFQGRVTPKMGMSVSHSDEDDAFDHDVSVRLPFCTPSSNRCRFD
jgi:hypothetical protein